MGLYSSDFSIVFRKLLEKARISCYRISQFTHLNEAYLSRLKNGEKCNPSPETIVKISLALTHFSEKIQLHDIEGLFNAGGRSLSVKW